MVRPIQPWYRSSRDAWFVTIDGRQVDLGVRGRRRRQAAIDAWHRLMPSTTTVPTLATVPTPIAVAEPTSDIVAQTTVQQWSDGFLAEEDRFEKLAVGELRFGTDG